MVPTSTLFSLSQSLFYVTNQLRVAYEYQKTNSKRICSVGKSYSWGSHKKILKSYFGVFRKKALFRKTALAGDPIWII